MKITKTQIIVGVVVIIAVLLIGTFNNDSADDNSTKKSMEQKAMEGDEYARRTVAWANGFEYDPSNSLYPYGSTPLKSNLISDSKTIDEYKEKQTETEETKQKELALNLVKQYPPNHTFMNIGDYLHIAYVADELPKGTWLVLPATYVKEGAYTVDYVTSKFQFNFAVDVETGEVIGKDKKDRLFMEYIRDLNQGGNYSEEILRDIDREIDW